MFLLKQDTTRKGRVDKKTLHLKFEDNSKWEKYEFEVSCDSVIYVKELESG